MKIGVLSSGNLGFDLIKKIESKYSISFALTDSGSEPIIKYCKKMKFPLFIGNPRNGNVREFLINKFCDVLLSINFLYIIEKDLINFPTRYSINLHGSLLPKYRGRTPHIWAIINNEKKTGITAHLINESCDTGDIIQQIEIPIENHDTGADILKKFYPNYWILIKDILSKIEENTLTTYKQNHLKATYYGKRIPSDGLINWNWQKERIYNWVRAQAYPYPGAFTYYNKQKLTIDKISFSDDGYINSIKNGTIISTSPVKIKTPNGIITLEIIRESYIKLNENNLLG